MMHSFANRWPGALLLCLLVCGCGSEAERTEVYPVSGRITMNGAPVANAAVIFSPKGKQPLATGRTDADGQYTLMTYEAGDGAAAGEYEVLVSKSVASSRQDIGHEAFVSGGGPPMHAGPQAADQASDSALPEKFGRHGESGMSATITPDGENEFNFELQL